MEITTDFVQKVRSMWGDRWVAFLIIAGLIGSYLAVFSLLESIALSLS